MIGKLCCRSSGGLVGSNSDNTVDDSLEYEED